MTDSHDKAPASPELEVPERFLPLLAGESRTVDLINQNKPVDLTVGDLKLDDPKASASWGEDRQLRARFVEWLITESDFISQLPAGRFSIIGARINGAVDFSFRTVTAYLLFRQCSISGGLRLASSRLRGLELSQTMIGSIQAWAAAFEGPVIFETVTLSGVLNMSNSKIVGDLSIRQSRFDAAGLVGINAANFTLEGNFSFEDSVLVGRINMINSTVKGEFNLNGSNVDATSAIALNADGITVSGRYFLRNSDVKGTVRMMGANIGGEVSLNTTKISRPNDFAFDARNAKIGGGVFLTNGFDASGRVALSGAEISGDLNLSAAKISRPQDVALDARASKIKGGVFLTNGATVEGTASLFAATIDGDLNCSSSTISLAPSPALDARRSKIAGTVNLNDGFSADKLVSLFGASVDGNLNLINANIATSDKAIELGAAKAATILIGESNIKGTVELYGAELSGDLIIRASTLKANPDSRAINLDNIRARNLFIQLKSKISGAITAYGATFSRDIQGYDFNLQDLDTRESDTDSRRALVSFFGISIGGDFILGGANIDARDRAIDLGSGKASNVRINNSKIKGVIDLFGAEFSGDIAIRKSRLAAGRYRRILTLDSVRARGLALEDEARFHGQISAYSAAFRGDVSVRNVTIEAYSPQDIVFNAHSMRCQGVLRWRDLPTVPSGIVSFEQAHVGSLEDMFESWPPQLRLAGFTYDQLPGNPSADVTRRIKWLKLQDRYYSQPFEHLIAFYRKLGDSDSAARVAIEKWRTRRSELPKYSFARVWDWFLDRVSGYGYRPERPLACLLAVLLIGVAVYDWGQRNGAFCQAETINAQYLPCTSRPHYPGFSPLAYSIETLLPIGDFGQRRSFVVRGDTTAGVVVSWYTFAHRLFGWIFSLLLALAPTNVLRRE
jgi:sRNA-binding regulator protein Hfq